MNDKKFWKIVYLYVTKYNYDIVYYRPEKKDVWLINDDNELIRFIYSDSFKSTEIDSVVSNIIKNEQRLKKMFRLNNLKIKILYVSESFDDSLIDYKKYKISNSLIIERTLFNERNRSLLIKEKDIKFIFSSPDTDRYKNRIVDLYKKQETKLYPFDFKFSLLCLGYVFLFIVNYMGLYFSKNFKFYDYLDYNYQKIISGQFYRLFTSSFIIEKVEILLLLCFTVIACSILFYKGLNIKHSLIVLLSSSFIFNMFLVIGYSGNIDIATVSYFSVLGSIFLQNINKKTNNINLLYSVAIPILYLLILFFLSNVNIILYMPAFIIGMFLQIFLLKRRHIFVAAGYIALVVILGIVIVAGNFNLKSKINNYKLSSVEKRLININSNTDVYKIEQELNSKNKSILTYYELGVIKITNSSIEDAKKIFLEGLAFDDSFAPIYYQLALMERRDSNFSKSKEYATRAYELDKNEKYKNLVDELSKR